MANSPVLGYVPYFTKNGTTAAAGWWIKGYVPGTTTPLTMYTDATTGTPLAKAQINEDGYPVTSGGAIFAPHFAAKHDLWLFTTEAAADANNTSGAVKVVSNGTLIPGAGEVARVFATVAAAKADAALVSGDTVRTLEHTSGYGYEGGNLYKIVAAGTGTADGGSYINLDNGLQAMGLFPNGPRLEQFGAAGDGSTDDTSAVSAFGAAFPGETLDLGGRTYSTTLTPGQVSGSYYNGQLLVTGSRSEPNLKKNQGPLVNYEVSNSSTKSPRVDWADTDLLWLGTSIPAEGQGERSAYPNLLANHFACTLVNNSFAGSHAGYDVDGDAFTLDTIKALSMTEDDRQAGLSAYGSTSAYDDSFDSVTKASEMTADFRIGNAFSSRDFDTVILDHNHNDRGREAGTLDPTSASIVSVTTGSSTTIELSSQIFSVGDAVALRVTGIDKLDYLAGRVQSISGNSITVSRDSSGYAGTFSSGTAYKLDRSTIYGAWEFLIYFIKNAKAVYGSGDVDIVLCSAPSEYTNNNGLDNGIYSSARYIRDVADKWDLAFFDVAEQYRINERDHTVYFPDNVHPTTLPARKALASYWINWASGGMAYPVAESDYLPAGENRTYTNNREALYSEFGEGFVTPQEIVGDAVAVANLDFASGLTGLTVTGTTVTAVSDPDGSGDTSLLFEHTPGTPVHVQDSYAVGENADAVVNIWLDSVVGLTDTSTPKIIDFFYLRSSGGVHYALQMIVRPSGVTVRPVYYETPAGTSHVIPSTAANLVAGQDNVLRLKVVKETALSKGVVLLYLNDELVASDYEASTSGLVAADSFRAGVMFSSIDKQFDFYLNRIGLYSKTVYDYSTRFTGSFTAQSGETVTVVNGIITSAV